MRNPRRRADASGQARSAGVEGQTAAVDGVRDGTAVETAGQHVLTNVTRAYADDTAELIVDRIRRGGTDHLGAVYVTDAAGRLVGQVELAAVLAADPARTMRSLAVEVGAVAQPEMDQERAASIAIAHHMVALPVVDAHGELLGVLPPEALMTVLRAEHLEDLHRLAGVRRAQLVAREAIEAPPLRRARDRLPWLLIGLAGSAIATALMRGFEATLERSVAVAFFIPGIVYMADAIGTQTEAAAVRGLSLVHEPLRELVWGEMRTGALMGILLAALALPAAWLAFGDGRLAVAVASALFFAGTVATTIGLVLPWALARTGRDPAYGSGPLATVIQDVLSILIYLAIASLVLG